MVYDCFQFYNEIDILLLRMNVLKDVVDYFVISEATETFSGLKKPLYFEENKELFKDFEEKIIHLVVDDTPEGYTHDRDTFQKNAVGRGLVGCKDDDIVIFSDLDEIPNPDKVKEVIERIAAKKDGDSDKIYHFAQRMFYCYLNMEETTGNLLAYCGEFEGVEKKKWLGTKMCRYALLKTMPIGELRWPKCKDNGVRIDDGGWHFGYMGGHNVISVRDRVSDKVKSAAHQEYNSKSVLNEVVDKIDSGLDMFGRDAHFERVEIDATFPKYLQDNMDAFSHLIKKKDSFITQKLRQTRLSLYALKHWINRTGYKILHGGK